MVITEFSTCERLVYMAFGGLASSSLLSSHLNLKMSRSSELVVVSNKEMPLFVISEINSILINALNII
jgi:hypothetical protein